MELSWSCLWEVLLHIVRKLCSSQDLQGLSVRSSNSFHSDFQFNQISKLTYHKLYHCSAAWMGEDWWNLFSLGDRDPGPPAHVPLTKRRWHRQGLAVSSCYRCPVTTCMVVNGPSGLLKRFPRSLCCRYGTITQGLDFELWKAQILTAECWVLDPP